MDSQVIEFTTELVLLSYMFFTFVYFFALVYVSYMCAVHMT